MVTVGEVSPASFLRGVEIPRAFKYSPKFSEWEGKVEVVDGATLSDQSTFQLTFTYIHHKIVTYSYFEIILQ